MNVNISSTVIPLLLLSIIFGLSYFKHYLNKKARKRLQEKILEEDLEDSDDVGTRQFVTNRTKYSDVDVFKYRKLFFNIGLVGSLAFALMAFSWTTQKETLYKPIQINIEDPHHIVEPPITKHKEPPPSLPPPPIVVEVTDDIDLAPLDLIDLSVDIDDLIPEDIQSPKESEEPLPPPPPLSQEEDEIDAIWDIAEQMPRFPGCKTGTKEEKRKCSDKKLIDYLYKNIKYPAVARDNGIQGRLYVQFVVNKDGTITEAQVIRDIGGGCGKAALKVVNDMNLLPEKWTPGKQRGRKVRVKYTLPVTFELNN